MAEKKSRGFDMARTGKFAIIGALYIAPMLHTAYSKIYPYLIPKTDFASTVLRVMVDQTCFAPTFLTGFFLIMNASDGGSMSQGFAALKDKFMITLVNNWKLWIPASFLNFYFIPNRFQVLWANFVSLFWNTYLSFMHNTYEKPEEGDKKTSGEASKTN